MKHLSLPTQASHQRWQLNPHSTSLKGWFLAILGWFLGSKNISNYAYFLANLYFEKSTISPCVLFILTQLKNHTNLTYFSPSRSAPPPPLLCVFCSCPMKTALPSHLLSQPPTTIATTEGHQCQPQQLGMLALSPSSPAARKINHTHHN